MCLLLSTHIVLFLSYLVLRLLTQAEVMYSSYQGRYDWTDVAGRMRNNSHIISCQRSSDEFGSQGCSFVAQLLC
jgi:hypothetical protein